jgi:hypothetical protein
MPSSIIDFCLPWQGIGLFASHEERELVWVPDTPARPFDQRPRSQGPKAPCPTSNTQRPRSFRARRVLARDVSRGPCSTPRINHVELWNLLCQMYAAPTAPDPFLLGAIGCSPLPKRIIQPLTYVPSAIFPSFPDRWWETLLDVVLAHIATSARRQYREFSYSFRPEFYFQH